MSKTSYVWINGSVPASAGHEFVIFRRNLDLDVVPPTQVELEVFAAHRYRLRVNGEILGYGPSRFVEGIEEFDHYDLRPYLRAGHNTVAVEACAIHQNNYQSMPHTAGRFIARGKIESASGAAIDLSTPGDWQCVRPTGWEESVPSFSFAIGPIEVFDNRQPTLPEAGWSTPMAMDRAYPMPGERTLASPENRMLQPEAVFAAPLQDDEARFGFLSVHPKVRSNSDQPIREQRFHYATFVHSPAVQSVAVGLHWGPHFLNGQPIETTPDPVRGNRLNATLDLRAGWNLLCGECNQLQPTYPLLIGLPRDADLTLRSRPDHGDGAVMRYTLPTLIDEPDRWTTKPPATADDLDLDSDAWNLVSEDATPHCPARMMSWDAPDLGRRVDAPAMPISVNDEPGTTLLLDLGGEYLGHVVIDIDARAGTLVDLAYDERLRGDGLLALFACNPFVEAADRFICRDGRQTFETFHPRGGRYVQVTIRPPKDAGNRATLHGVAVRSIRCLTPVVGRFACDHDTLNWAWDHGAESLQSSIEDTYCDSPWRERGTYLGDSYVQSLVHMCVCDDHRIIRRALRLFAQGQREDGQLPGVVPAWLRAPHGDFTLIYSLWLRDYWARTGDLDRVRACLPAAIRAVRSGTWQTSPHSPLWDATRENRLFIDWGAIRDIRTYDENGVLNALRIRALECLAELHRAMGDNDAAAPLEEEIIPLADVFRKRLWLPDQGRFAAGTADGQPIEREILHVNILALTFGLADAQQQPALERYVLDRLAGNAAHALKATPADDFAEFYFLKYVLDGLVRIGRFDVAERMIAEHVQPMIDRGAWTYWECLHRGIVEQGSLCHAWSTAPLEYLTRYVLGVREIEPGRPDRLMVDPRAVGIRKAEGVFPHPRGPVTVRWTRDGEGPPIVEASGPAGVELVIQP